MNLLTLTLDQFISIFILIVLTFYVLIITFNLLKYRKDVNFIAPIVNSGNSLSKSGILFFLITLVVVYQALCGMEITDGLLEILGALAFKDAGVELANKWERVQLNKIKKTTTKLDIDEFKNL